MTGDIIQATSDLLLVIIATVLLFRIVLGKELHPLIRDGVLLLILINVVGPR